MKNLLLKACLSIVAVTMPPTLEAKINGNKPPFSLSLEQTINWTPDSQFADSRNISTEPLRSRYLAPLNNPRAKLDPNVKVLLAPDGMNNLANYVETQDKFNLYNFTQWGHVDVLNWFTGEAPVNVPARPWVDAAHKHGVKVIGTVFFRPAIYGGKSETVERFLVQDQNGAFPFADKLIELANFYGFDGWLMNQETDLTVVKDANNQVVEGQFDYQRAAALGKKMQAFMVYLTDKAPPAMEIHWYDAMLLDGSVRWQNALNQKSGPFIEDKQLGRTSDAMFMNYWWRKSMVEDSVSVMKSLGRSPYDLYFGADLWPDRNAQRIFKQTKWLDALFEDNGQQGLTSIALFANNASFIFSGSEKQSAFSRFRQNANDHQSFYITENRLFIGDDLNLATNDKIDSWPGIGRYVPAKTTISGLPFVTHFNTGHGKVWAQEGQIQIRPWHNLSLQDIQPTWQFAHYGNSTLEVGYNFDTPYQGGSALALSANLTKGEVNLPLYQTRLLLTEQSGLNMIYQQNGQKAPLYVWLTFANGDQIRLPTKAGKNGWQKLNVSLAKYAGQLVERIGLGLSKNKTAQFEAAIGKLEIN